MARSASVAKAKRQQFIAVLETDAKEFNPLGPLAQAILETGNFKYIVGWNNFWGIKVPRKSPWNGKVVEAPTTEHFPIGIHAEMINLIWFINRNLHRLISLKVRDHQVIVRVTQEFCDWEREGEAVKYYKSMIQRLYPMAWVNKRNPEKFFRGLIGGKRKWATDPKYEGKLLSVYRRLKREGI